MTSRQLQPLVADLGRDRRHTGGWRYHLILVTHDGAGCWPL